jgi:hypothetical protein
MTTQEVINSLKAKVKILSGGQLVAIAAQDTHVKMSERIFDNNENSTGGKIGDYNSIDAIYVNPKNSPKKFPTLGKPDKNGKRKTGETGYFESYKAYREKIGRQTKSVDLKLFGRLQSDFTKGVIKVDDLTYTSGVNQDNADKVEGAEDRYGKIFSLTEEEKQHFHDVLEFESFKVLR